MDKADFDRQFVQRLTASQSQLYAYILSMHPNRADADELMQETAMALWQKRYEYDASADFLPWGITFARFEVLRHRRKLAQRSIAFDSDMVQAIADACAKEIDMIGAKQSALEECLKHLPADRQELLQQKYADALTVPQIAESSNRTPAALYKLIGRTHDLLLDCVKRKLANSP